MSSYHMQEEADIYTGHILLYGALIRSGLLFKGTAEEQTEVFNSTIEAGSKRSYLLLPSHTFLITLLNKVTLLYDFLVLAERENSL
jgi:hypothetical protein